MATDSRFALSRLEPLRQYLVQSVDMEAGLLDALEEALPAKGLDKLVKLLDNLLQHPRGAEVLTLTFCFLLDEWLRDADERLQRTNQGADPFTWLATSDHVEVVQTFRDLL